MISDASKPTAEAVCVFLGVAISLHHDQPSSEVEMYRALNTRTSETHCNVSGLVI